MIRLENFTNEQLTEIGMKIIPEHHVATKYFIDCNQEIDINLSEPDRGLIDIFPIFEESYVEPCSEEMQEFLFKLYTSGFAKIEGDK